MIELRRILCPVDFSDCARRALDQALALARWSGAGVTVLHVAAAAAEADAADHEGPDRELRRFLEAHGAPGVALDAAVARGPAAAAILDHAVASRADLLVLGTRGRSGWKRLVLGSVAEQVLRAAPCPVLTVPPGQPEAVPATPALYREILCPVDFSDASVDALQFAAALVEGGGGRVTVAHVLGHDLRSTPELYDTALSDRGLSDAAYRERRIAHVRERLREIVPGAAAACRVEALGPGGAPAREILRLAAAQQSDLIVLGIRPRSGADLLVLGSTTHDVLREASCAVLTVCERRQDRSRAPTEEGVPWATREAAPEG